MCFYCYSFNLPIVLIRYFRPETKINMERNHREIKWNNSDQES